MKSTNRRARRTHRSLHNALMSLILEKNYDSVTVQKILDRADVGRSTFYAHFDGKDELLLSGTEDLRNTLDAALHEERLSTKRHDVVIGFSGAIALNNVDQAVSMTGATQERYALAHKMSTAFASFARTGNPNHADLPNWPAFNKHTYPTMVFANECKLLNDPNREERPALKAIRELWNTTTTVQ